MFYDLKIENYLGELLQLTQNPAYTVVSVTGLNPVKAQINTSENALSDGAVFNGSKLATRNIVIKLFVEEPVEKNRIALYRFIKPGKVHKLHYANGLRDVKIEGYVETAEVGYFDKKEAVQISLLCPRPALLDEGSTEVDFSSVQALFEFPFSIAAAGIPFSELEAGRETIVINNGDIEAGVIVVIRALGSSSNPVIYNVTNDTVMRLGINLVAGDVLTISTGVGAKSITLLRDGTETNELNALAVDSDWISVEPGANSLTYTAAISPENLECKVMFTQMFEGV